MKIDDTGVLGDLLCSGQDKKGLAHCLTYAKQQPRWISGPRASDCWLLSHEGGFILANMSRVLSLGKCSIVGCCCLLGQRESTLNQPEVGPLAQNMSELLPHSDKVLGSNPRGGALPVSLYVQPVYLAVLLADRQVKLF